VIRNDINHGCPLVGASMNKDGKLATRILPVDTGLTDLYPPVKLCIRAHTHHSPRAALCASAGYPRA
jgi:hypothetical protein